MPATRWMREWNARDGEYIVTKWRKKKKSGALLFILSKIIKIQYLRCLRTFHQFNEFQIKYWFYSFHQIYSYCCGMGLSFVHRRIRRFICPRTKYKKSVLGYSSLILSSSWCCSYFWVEWLHSACTIIAMKGTRTIEGREKHIYRHFPFNNRIVAIVLLTRRCSVNSIMVVNGKKSFRKCIFRN